MTALTHHPALPRGRLLVLLCYGSLLAQVAQFALYRAADLPRAVNVFQFVAIAGVAAGWLGLWRVTRGVADPGRRGLDERERAIRERAGWTAFRIMGSALALLSGGYVVLHDGLDVLPEPSPAALSLLAFAIWVLTWTLPQAVLAWTQHPPVDDELSPAGL
jgi:uncharacterized membrane protein